MKEPQMIDHKRLTKAKLKKLKKKKHKLDQPDIDPSYQRQAGHTHLLGHDPIGGRGREWR
jgi:hypothetical protein